MNTSGQYEKADSPLFDLRGDALRLRQDLTGQADQGTSSLARERSSETQSLLELQTDSASTETAYDDGIETVITPVVCDLFGEPVSTAPGWAIRRQDRIATRRARRSRALRMDRSPLDPLADSK